jgi:hypothetical protein
MRLIGLQYRARSTFEFPYNTGCKDLFESTVDLFDQPAHIHRLVRLSIGG